MRKTRNVTDVLTALRELEGPYGAEIARHTGLAHPTVSRVCKRLYEEGWVVIRSDGRKVRYYLTPLGASWAEAWRPR